MEKEHPHPNPRCGPEPWIPFLLGLTRKENALSRERESESSRERRESYNVCADEETPLVLSSPKLSIFTNLMSLANVFEFWVNFSK